MSSVLQKKHRPGDPTPVTLPQPEVYAMPTMQPGAHQDSSFFSSNDVDSKQGTSYRPPFHHKGTSSVTYVGVPYDTEATPFKHDPHHVDWTKEDKEKRREPNWLERRLHLPMPLIYLLFHSIVSILWGTALAVFMSGVVTITFAFSEGLRKLNEEHDFDYSSELVGLVGSLATMHVTYVLQLIVAEYSHIVMAKDFTLRDLRWMQGVNEMSLFAKFPGRSKKGLPEDAGWLRRTSWAIINSLTALRIGWYIVYFGVALHTMSIVAIMSPQLKIQHVEFQDVTPCGVQENSLTLDREPFMSEAQQEVIDKLAFDVGIQLAAYIDEVNGNTTTTLAGRKYRKEPFAYGHVGGLVEGLQDQVGVEFNADCVNGRDTILSTQLWQSVLPDLSPPSVSEPWQEFVESPGSTIPSSHRRVVSDPSLTFDISITQGALYGVVDPQGDGAFMILAQGRDRTVPMQMVCAWSTTPRLIHVQTVNFTSLALDVKESDLWPSLTGRATLRTLEGMAAAARFGASLDPDANIFMRRNLLNADLGNAPPSEILEKILADGIKAAVTAYNTYWTRLDGKVNPGDPPMPQMCKANNKTVAEHYRFGNDKYLGWIAVLWTIGIGVMGVVLTFWMAKKKSNRMDLSPLDAMGGFMLGRGGEIGDDQRLRIVDGKVVDVPAPEKL